MSSDTEYQAVMGSLALGADAVTFGKLPAATGIGWARNKFIDVHLEVFATDAVMGADQPLLEITNGRIRRLHNRLRTLSNGFAKVGREGPA